MSLDILIIGGTRLLGKKIVENFISSGKPTVYVLSRRSTIHKDKYYAIESERSEGIVKLKDKLFDIVIDFIAYGEKNVEEAMNGLKFRKYIFISSCWMTKLNKKYKADEFIRDVDERAVKSLPSVTQNYLMNKRAGENYLDKNIARGTFHIIRLPIFWGENDHTRRLEFYISRLRDNKPVLMINEGANICQIDYVSDLASNLVTLIYSNKLTDQVLLEALPDQGRKVSDIINIIKKGVGSKSELKGVGQELLGIKLPDYLEAEPLWRENRVDVTGNNTFLLGGAKSEPVETWLETLSAGESLREFQTPNLRARELELMEVLS